MGSIIKISPVYQTPAIGFDGDDFLNCVLQIRSHYSPSETLKKVFSIEKELGRVREESNGFSSRPIDIDILFFEVLRKQWLKN